MAALVARADAPVGRPEWRGMTDLGHGPSFLLVASPGASGQWAKVGDSVGDWKVADYRINDRALVIEDANGRRFDLLLLPSPAAPGVTPAESRAQQNQYVINFLKQRSEVLRVRAEDAEKKLAAFKAEHAGIDPAQGESGSLSEEAAALQKQAEVARANDATMQDRLAQTLYNIDHPNPNPTHMRVTSSGSVSDPPSNPSSAKDNPSAPASP